MQQITVQKLWPLDGKPNGGFKGTDGNAYKCDAATHFLLQEGMTFEANVKPSQFNGKTYYWLPKGFNPPSSVRAPVQQAAQNAAPAGTPLVANSPNSNGYVPEMEKQG